MYAIAFSITILKEVIHLLLENFYLEQPNSNVNLLFYPSATVHKTLTSKHEVKPLVFSGIKRTLTPRFVQQTISGGRTNPH
jgi:hypothetical protein